MAQTMQLALSGPSPPAIHHLCHHCPSWLLCWTMVGFFFLGVVGIFWVLLVFSAHHSLPLLPLPVVVLMVVIHHGGGYYHLKTEFS